MFLFLTKYFNKEQEICKLSLCFPRLTVNLASCVSFFLTSTKQYSSTFFIFFYFTQQVYCSLLDLAHTVFRNRVGVNSLS